MIWAIKYYHTPISSLPVIAGEFDTMLLIMSKSLGNLTLLINIDLHFKL